MPMFPNVPDAPGVPAVNRAPGASSATPLMNERAGLPLPSWFFPLRDDDALAAHVAELESTELAEWEKQVTETEALRDSQRATDLLRSRRGAKSRPLL
jgi:hypothetical protein